MLRVPALIVGPAARAPVGDASDHATTEGPMREIVCDRYVAADGPRELVYCRRRRLAPAHRPQRVRPGDPRLLAHLAPDEPDANARLVCCDYLRADERHARALTRTDLRSPRGLARVPTRRPVRAGRADRRRRPSLRAASSRHTGRAALDP